MQQRLSEVNDGNHPEAAFPRAVQTLMLTIASALISEQSQHSAQRRNSSTVLYGLSPQTGQTFNVTRNLGTDLFARKSQIA